MARIRREVKPVSIVPRSRAHHTFYITSLRGYSLQHSRDHACSKEKEREHLRKKLCVGAVVWGRIRRGPRDRRYVWCCQPRTPIPIDRLTINQNLPVSDPSLLTNR